VSALRRAWAWLQGSWAWVLGGAVALIAALAVLGQRLFTPKAPEPVDPAPAREVVRVVEAAAEERREAATARVEEARVEVVEAASEPDGAKRRGALATWLSKLPR